MATDAASRRRVNTVLASLAQFANSRSLDLLHAARSGVPLSLAAIGVLGRIVRQSPIGLTELRAQTRLQAAALSRHIRILEEGGYIERWGDPNDGRAAVVQATKHGKTASRKWGIAADELLSAQLVDWTAEELDELCTMMERLDSDLRSMDKRSRHERDPLATDAAEP
jgi:DNA-binding MarR family transcriptional regulator